VIEVVGLTARGWEELPERLRGRVLQAEVLLGSPRLFALVPPVESGQQRLTWPSPMRPGLLDLLDRVDGRSVVALASGDPLVAGIGGTLIDLLGPERVRLHPAVSSVALARARMGWSDESVDVVRLRDDVDPLRRWLSPGRRLVVLSADRDSPAAVARLLAEAGFGATRMTVLSDLGADTETRVDTTAEGWSGPAAALNLIALECVGEGWSLTPGLPDPAYDHDGQLTKRDVRASALAHLEPRPGQLLWDVGAGAGSIAIEWLRSDPSTRAIAIEHNLERVKRIQANAAQLGVPQLSVRHGEAPDAFTGLPQPQAIFVGGGATADLLARAWAALDVGGRLVVHAVTHETELTLSDAWRTHGGELTRISIEHLEPIGRYHGWKPARPVVQWSVRKP
jgi:precorrin-6Y C5,15-methyltransferase (decarboxylating)